MFSNLRSLRFQPLRHAPAGIGNWSGHLLFAADLIQAVKPAVLVELGTHHGESYFGFCQAIQECQVNCQAFAVDTWQGDGHTGRYNSLVFEEVNAYNSSHYHAFSTLLRMNFDHAATRFSDQTINLLHLDGFHTYSAVKHDFEKWLPKVAQNGIILIHDIAVRRGDFGAWQFWEEIRGSFPSFAFEHSCGLGVIAKTNEREFADPLLAALFGGTCDPQSVRDYYVLCADRLQLSHEEIGKVVPTCQLFSPDAAGYSEDRSGSAPLQAGKWINIDVDLPAPAGRLRLDPSNCESMVEISEFVVECASSGRILWRLDPAKNEEILAAGNAILIPDEGRLLMLSYGNDPQLFLPVIEGLEPGSSVRCRGCLLIDQDYQLLRRFVERAIEQRAEIALISASPSRTQSECDGACARIHQQFETFSERLALNEADLRTLAEFRSLAEADVEEQRTINRQLERDLEALRTSCDAAVAQRTEILRSLSWRITAPLRSVGSLLAFRGGEP